jgi:hypothetical protein
MISSACSSPPPDATEPPSTTEANVTAADPYPEAAADTEAYPEAAAGTEAYPGAESSAPATRPTVVFDIPEPTSEGGVIYGKMHELTTGEPFDAVMVGGINVYLAEIIESERGLSEFATLDTSTAPSSGLDSQGTFVFSGVEPGRYAVVIDTPAAQRIARESPDTEENALVTVEAGEAVDVGTVYTQFP